MWPAVAILVVNHCVLEVEVLEAPQVRYTQDNQTPVAEMAVQVEGLRPDDPPGQIKVVGWGNLAQDLQNRVQVGQRLMLEGRLRMNTVTRADGVKEKRAEFTLARLHHLAGGGSPGSTIGSAAPIPPGPTGQSAPRSVPRPVPARPAPAASPAPTPAQETPTWNSSPLVPDLPEDDDIPF
jgi:single-strand DNA-binding protein